MTQLDYEAIFRASPYPYLVMDNNLHVLDANDAYLRSTHATRNAIVGKYVFDAFPSNPEDPSSTNIEEVKKSLEKAIATGLPDITPFLRYAVPKTRGETNDFDEKYWSTVSTPILGPDGKTAFVVQHPIDVTDLYSFNKISKVASVDSKVKAAEGAENFNRAQMHEAMLRILHDERGHLRNLFNQSPGFVAVLLGPNHVFEMVNEAYYQLVGHRSILGKPVWEALPEVQGQGFEELLDGVYRTGKAWVGRSTPLNIQPDPNGPMVRRYVDLLYQPVFDAQGNVSGIFAQGHDVTEAYESQMAHREIEARLEEGMMAARMVVWDWAVAASTMVFSENASAILGCIPITIDEFMSQVYVDDRRRLEAAIQRAKTSESNIAETVRFVRPDNHEPIWIDIRGRILREERNSLIVMRGVTLDITDRMQATEKLRLADQQKDEFLAMLAHELRNPLAPISSAAQILKLGKLDPSLLKNTSDIITRQVGHMTGLVDDLLDVSRVTRGLITTDMVSLNLKHVISDAIEQSSSLVQSKQHSIFTDITSQEVLVLGDHKRMVQVVTNILTNAAKYTPSGGTIWVRLTAQADVATISVEDNGIGITPELLPRIFDLFTQAERTSDRAQGGLGIGLALVKRLVELHNGTVKVISHPGTKGSRFDVILPRIEARSASHQPTNLPEVNPKHVLVVDDNKDAATMLALYLEALGHSVDVVFTAAGARDYLVTHEPEVILLDIGLPEMDGNSLAKYIRSVPKFANTLLIAVTGYGAEEQKREAFAAGFNGHLVKPVDTVELQNLLSKCTV